METISKEKLIKRLTALKKLGWVENGRFGNHGGIGNTLEDYLGIKENNLPIPNAREWELKTQRKKTSSLTTLFHIEPSPRALKIVPSILLLKYGWKHQGAGLKYSSDELSFRQTISTKSFSDRGFIVKVDNKEQKVKISFDKAKVDERHKEWLKSVEKRVGLGELNPQPYWGFKDLEHKAGTKLLNCFYVQAEVKKEDGKEYYWYDTITILKGFTFSGLLKAIEQGEILVEFDARTGHNHGTKFRMRQGSFEMLYEEVIKV